MNRKQRFSQLEAIDELLRLNQEIRSFRNDKCFPSFKWLRERKRRLDRLARGN